MAEQEAAFCPNCNKPAIRQGKIIICEHCDNSFRYTPEGPKIHEIGPLEKRLSSVEAAIRKLLGDNHEPPAEPPERDEDNDNGDDEDDGI